MNVHDSFMNINTSQVPVISVSYNSAELIEDLLQSFRRFYTNPITIIDGSATEYVPGIEQVCNKYSDVTFIHFDYNIHHGPGMAWAFQNLQLSGPVLVLDSDVSILKKGFLESMLDALKPDMYGVGSISYVNEGGYDVDYRNGAIRYLHPACMLCNIEVVRRWPMPIKHGAPMVNTMLAIHNAGQHGLVGDIEWLTADFSKQPAQNFIRHDWQGTVKRSGGYHLEEWEKAAQDAAKVRLLTLSLMPAQANRVVEIGASDGALARGFKGVNAECHYTALHIDPDTPHIEAGVRDRVLQMDVRELNDDLLRNYADTDCWVLDHALERMQNPEHGLQSIRKVIRQDGCVVAVVPNAQHWSLQAKLCIGDLRYGSSGLLQPSTVHWFTRATMFELFQNAGYRIVQGFPIVHAKIENPTLANAIKQFATSVGANPELALEDAQAHQYVVKAVPV
jgi:SAM-dependent methyltransferase